MGALLAGLVLFVVVHSVRLPGESWRARQIARFGLTWWRVGHSVLSTAGFVLVVLGYEQVRAVSSDVWPVPDWARYVTAVLMYPVFVLWLAALAPGTTIKAWVGQPGAAGSAIWAFAHLLANARAADLTLFGSLFVWAMWSLVVGWRRDREIGRASGPGSPARDLLVLASAAALWLFFSCFLHAFLIGVTPLQW